VFCRTPPEISYHFCIDSAAAAKYLIGMTELKTKLIHKILRITPEQAKAKEEAKEARGRFIAYIEQVTNGIPWEERHTRGRIEGTRAAAPWFNRYV